MTAQGSCLTGNMQQRSPCLLVIDRSAGGARSRQGTTAQALERGLQRLRDGLLADPQSPQQVQLCLVDACSAADANAAVLVDWVDAAQFVPPMLPDGDGARLSQAMRLALNLVEQHKQALREDGITFTRPWIMVLSASPADEPAVLWRSVAQDCRQAAQDQRCVVFPIALEGADASALAALSNAPVARLGTDRIGAFFDWLVKSLATTSRGVIGTSVRLPPVDAWAVF